MKYSGIEAINVLSRRIYEDDPTESSHWKKFHGKFSYKNGILSGIKGFGGSQPTYQGFRKKIHNLFQRKYRKIGAKFPKFDTIDFNANQITKKQERAYDLDVLRQTLTASFLSTFPNVLGSNKQVLIIGDGFGSLTSILLASKLSRQVILVNLTKTLLVDLLYLKKWMGDNLFNKSTVLIDSEVDIPSISSSKSLIAIEAINHKLIRSFNIDSIINVASMQEMNPSMVKAYFKDFSFISKDNLYFYCCNREEKILPDGTVSRFLDYPWNKKDSILLDELCPWHQYYYTLIPPMYKRYEGPHRHQLRIMKFN